MLIAIWILTALALVAWSLLAWGTHALLTLDPGRVGALGPLIEKIPYGEWIDRWIPGWQDLLRLALELTQVVLGWVGSAAPIVVGVAWGVGTLGLLGVAGLLTLLVKLARPKPAVPAAAA